MTNSILYCGDTELTSAASYLAGLMTHAGWEFEYVPSHQPLTREIVATPRKLFIFSDYPAAQAATELQAAVVAQVAGGAGLLMIGGWESFHGLGGDWDGTPVGNALGVTIAAVDDRQNSFSPAMLVAEGEAVAHPILQGLPWTERPAFVGGWNHIRAGQAQTLLTIRQFGDCRLTGEGALIGQQTLVSPGLTVHQQGTGRTATFLSDVAPHWVGGFVDWGDARVTAQAPGAPAIEVGNWYAQFWSQLLAWTGRLA